MLNSSTSQRFGALAAACLLSVALPSAPAWAQKTKIKGEQATAANPAHVSVEIPSIETVGSNVDDDTLREVFSGNLAENAEALAGLTAQSISIPQITVTTVTELDDEEIEATVSFNNIVLEDVREGVATSLTIAGADIASGDDATGQFGAISASTVSIAGLLGLYGLVDSSGKEDLETIYTNFSFEGATITSEEADCTVGAMSGAELRARPLKTSMGEMMALLEHLEEQKDEEEPDPESVGALLRMYADMFTAFESSPFEFEGFDCNGTDEEGQQIAFSAGTMTLGAFSPGIYPSITMSDLAVSMEGDGEIAIGEMHIKPMDLTGPISVVEGAPEAISQAWLEENARALIPAFEGFSFSEISADVPDPEDTDTRIRAAIGSFDLTLLDYINGIPTDLSTEAEHIVLDLPEDSGDETVEQLISLGVTSVDAGFALKASWDEESETIVLEEASVTGADLATVVLTGTIANATAALFYIDPEASLAAAMAVAVHDLTADVTDEGLSDIILEAVAADQGSDPATMRPVFAGLAQGTVVGMLAGAAEAQKVGEALNSFVSGASRHLTIELTAKEQPGVSVTDFMAMETDPGALVNKVTVNAKAD